MASRDSDDKAEKQRHYYGGTNVGGDLSSQKRSRQVGGPELFEEDRPQSVEVVSSDKMRRENAKANNIYHGPEIFPDVQPPTLSQSLPRGQDAGLKEIEHRESHKDPLQKIYSEPNRDKSLKKKNGDPLSKTMYTTEAGIAHAPSVYGPDAISPLDPSREAGADIVRVGSTDEVPGAFRVDPYGNRTIPLGAGSAHNSANQSSSHGAVTSTAIGSLDSSPQPPARQDSTDEYATVPVDYFGAGISPSKNKAKPSVTRKKMIVLIIAVLVVLVGVGAGVGVGFSSKSDNGTANDESDVDDVASPPVDPDLSTAVPTSTLPPTSPGEQWIQLGQDIDGEATGDEYGQVSNRGPCQHHTYANLMTLFPSDCQHLRRWRNHCRCCDSIWQQVGLCEVLPT